MSDTVKEVTKRLRAVTVAEASEVLFEAIKNDPELYRAYQANIAMAFKDEAGRRANVAGSLAAQGPSDVTYTFDFMELHDIANTAAQNFLNLLIK